MITTKYIVFGWAIHRSVLTDGEELTAVWPKDTPMDTAANWSFFTKGARVVSSYPADFTDDAFIQQRGLFSNKTAFVGLVYKRGTYVFKAVGDTEFWCLDYLLNDNSAPDFEFVLLPAGQTYTTSVGQLILIASGDTDLGAAPLPVEIVSRDKVITANTDASLIIFSRVK
jgi:hypothetical protein